MKSTTEDYIKHIYLLQASGIRIRTSVLAELMHISMPSVSEMVKKLTDSGYISSRPYHGFKLTRQGEELALTLIRKHRLLEYFMVKVLNFEWEEVHQEAEKLEHAVSEKFINSLEKVLGYPESDPHGHPIPDIRGKIKTRNSIPLSEAPAGKYYTVSSVSDRSEEILKYLKDIGVQINSKIKIKGSLSFDGSVIMYYKKKKYLFSRKIAQNIFVNLN
jgi:DtxR family transcriptional regulator, Mn-dependent transcriptional regulator